MKRGEFYRVLRPPGDPDYVGELTTEKLRELDVALLVALGIPTLARPSAGALLRRSGRL